MITKKTRKTKISNQKQDVNERRVTNFSPIPLLKVQQNSISANFEVWNSTNSNKMPYNNYRKPSNLIHIDTNQQLITRIHYIEKTHKNSQKTDTKWLVINVTTNLS